MNEHITAQVFVELVRIGIDFDSLSVPLAGTGLRASEIVDWLREIPDGAGADELLRRLRETARNAVVDRPVHIRWRREPARPPHRGQRERWWPTQALLDAGTEMLIEEWDPFTIRHAGVDREEIATFAFHLFECFLSPNGSIDPIAHAAGMLEDAERTRLDLVPSPEPHRRYLAARLQELVRAYPVPSPEYWPPQAVMVVEIGGPGGPPALDPEGVCVACHSFGTVARMTVQSSPPRTTRYCAKCARIVRRERVDTRHPPETASEHVAFLDRVHRPPMTWESRSWDDLVDMVQMAQEPGAFNDSSAAEREMGFAEWARQFVAMDGRMDGPKPAELEAFVRKHKP